VAIEEEDGVEGLVLGGGGDIAFNCEVGEEGFDFGDTHFVGVTFVVEEDEAANPLNVGFFCPIGVVFEANGIADLVKELSGWVLHDVLPEIADSANHSIMGA
jgi:hypothetical protein